MTSNAFMARRSARTFEHDGLFACMHSSGEESVVDRNGSLDEKKGHDGVVEGELYRHSRNSSTSSGSDTSDDYQIGTSGLQAAASDEKHAVNSSKFDGHSLKEKLESRPELNFGNVIPDVYRAGCPEAEDHIFLQSLGLKTMLSLIDKKRPEAFEAFIEQNGIKHVVAHLEGTKHGIPIGPVEHILSIVLDKRNYPLLIHCNHGRHRTGCIVAIVRKINGMEVASVIEEYKHFSAPKPRDIDIDYITKFSVESVEEVVKKTTELCTDSAKLAAGGPFTTSKMAQLVCGVAACLCIWGMTILRW